MLLFYLIAFLLSLTVIVFSGQLLTYVLTRLLPLVVPVFGRDVQLELKRLTVLRAQDCRIIFPQVSPTREVEWSRTLLVWFFEGALPVGITGLEIKLDLITLLSRPAKTRPTLKKKRKNRIPRWIWRFLFKLLSRVLVNILDLKISFEDIGLSLSLQQVAVLFKSDGKVPCRAALKAKDLKFSFTKKDVEGEIEVLEFCKLSELAITASLHLEKPVPKLEAAKLALGEMEIIINQRLVEGGLELVGKLPKKKQVSSPKTKKVFKTEQLDKILGKDLPSKLGGGLHQLKVSCPELASSLLLKTLHVGLESPQTDSLELSGDLKKGELKLGVDGEQQGLLVEILSTQVSSQVVRQQGQIKVSSQLEMGVFKTLVDDELFWKMLWDSKLYFGVGIVPITQSSQESEAKEEKKSVEELMSLDHDSESYKSEDSDSMYRRLYDSGDIGLLKSAEEQEFVEEISVAEDLPKERKIPLWIDLAQLDWEITFSIKQSFTCSLRSHADNSIIIGLFTKQIQLEGNLNKEARNNHHCFLGITIQEMNLQSDDVELGEVVEIQECKGRCTGPLKTEDESERGLVGTLTLATDGSLCGIALTAGSGKLHRAHGVFEAFYQQLRTHVKSPRKHKTPKQRNLVVEISSWKGKISELSVDYDVEICPVQEYSTEDSNPSCKARFQVSNILASSGASLSETTAHASTLQLSLQYGSPDQQDQIQLLEASSLGMSMKKQIGLTSVKLDAAGVHFDIEIDLAFLALQLMEDFKSLLSKTKSMGRIPGQSEGSTSNLEKVQSSASHGVPVRVPSKVHCRLKSFVLDVKVTDLNGIIRIADSDTLSISMLNLSAGISRRNPTIFAERFILEMNKEKILESLQAELRIIGPCFLTELIQAQGSDPQGKNPTSSEMKSLSFKGFAEKLVDKDEDIVESRNQKWRMKGCSSMGITEFVVEDYSGDGTVLDFFSIEIQMQTLVFILPHNQHLGRLILYLELWSEAIKDAVQGKLPKNPKSSLKDQAKKKEGPADLVEVCISAEMVLFRLDPHPLEAWLALHGPHLHEAIILRQAWETTLNSLHEDLDSKLETGAIEWVHQAVFQDYRKACLSLQDSREDLMFHQGALMSVVASNVHALVLVGDRKSPNIIKACIQKIKELDYPTSNEITFARVQPIYIEASAENIHAHFDGLQKPSALVKSVGFSGLIARGRQLTHHPKTHVDSFKVGRWHEVQKHLPVKGAKPPMKVYTDMEVVLNELDANGGIGLESLFCQLSKSFNRLIPPSQVKNDGSLPEFTGHVLQTWDKIRYTWRGKMSIEINHLRAAVAANLVKFVDVQTPRLELQAKQMKAEVVAGSVLVDCKELDLMIFTPGLRSAPEASLHDFPLCHWPEAKIIIHYKWQMPQNRSPLLHHAFPVVSTPDPELKLDPVDLFKLFVGEGYTLEIHADLENHADPLEVPKIIMGEAQVRFLIGFFKLMEDAPVMVRGCWKRGTYFLKKDKHKKCITPELPNLLHRIAVSLKAPKLAVLHHVLESEDPSDQLLITCEEVLFNGTWAFLNKIEEATALREGRFVKKSRYQEIGGVWRHDKSKVQTPDMEDLAVSAVNIQGYLPETHTTHPILTREAPEGEISSTILSLLSGTGSVLKEDQKVAFLPPDGMKGRVLTAGNFNLKQRSKRQTDPHGDIHVLMPNGEIKRPLHIQLSDVKVLMPLEVRNAVVGVYMHMLSAFVGPPKPSSSRPRLTSSKRLSQEPVHDNQDTLTNTNRKSTDAELLKTLLMQDEQGLGPRMSDIRGRTLPSRQDSEQVVDPPPAGSKMILQMEFHHVQLSCLSNISMGGVLVCLEHGLLFENFSEEQNIRSMGLRLQQVQAYHMDTQIDPMNPIRWLESIQGTLSVPIDSQNMLSLILYPFEAELSDLHLMMLAQAMNPGRAAEELKIYAPSIEAITDSEQFEMLVDVINSVATPPPPEIKLMDDTILGPTGSALEDTSEEITEAKEILKGAYRGFNDLRNEAYEINLLSSTDQSSKLVLTRSLGAKYLEQTITREDKIPSCHQALSLVLNILEEKIEVAGKVCRQSASNLREIRKHVELTNKHKKLYKSMNMQLSIKHVSWKLINKKQEFMLAQIKRVFFKSFQNKDLSGESKISVYRIELRDTRGNVPAGSGLDTGVVLSVLEPSGSDEEVLRGLAIRGAQTSSHIYYDHIEAWVHRFGLNFNETIAMELAGFFFPTDDDEIVRKHEEKWAKFAADGRPEMEVETEVNEKNLRREESLTGSSFEGRTRTSSFLDPLTYNTLPVESRRESLLDTLHLLPENDPLDVSSDELNRKKKRRKKGLVKSRKIQFVHVRFNKIVAHVTYIGRPFSFKGLTLTLGTSEYNSLEGSWRGLFKKYRNGVIGSVIKSIASHEGRSYDSKLTVGDGKKEKSATSRLLQKGKKLFHRKDKATSSTKETVEQEKEDDDEMAVDVLDEEEGRNLLLGKM